MHGPDGDFLNPFDRGWRRNCADTCTPAAAPGAPFLLKCAPPEAARACRARLVRAGQMHALSASQGVRFHGPHVCSVLLSEFLTEQLLHPLPTPLAEGIRAARQWRCCRIAWRLAAGDRALNTSRPCTWRSFPPAPRCVCPCCHLVLD